MCLLYFYYYSIINNIRFIREQKKNTLLNRFRDAAYKLLKYTWKVISAKCKNASICYAQQRTYVFLFKNMYRIPFECLLNFVSPELISDHGGENDKCPACPVPRRSSLFDQNAKHSVGERLSRVQTRNHFARCVPPIVFLHISFLFFSP